MPSLHRALVALGITLSVAHEARALEPLDAAALGEGATLVIRPRVAGLEVSFLPGAGAPRRWTLALLSPAGGSSAEVDVTFPAERVAPLVVVLPRPTREVADRDLRLSLRGKSPARELIGLVGPWLEAPRMRVFGDPSAYAGTRYAPRVVVDVPIAGCVKAPCTRALVGATIEARWVPPGGKKKRAVPARDAAIFEARVSARTDASGSAPLAIAVPDRFEGELALELTAHHPDGSASARQTINVIAGSRILLSTDKPIYQPGQTLHLRLLARARGTGRAAGGTAARLEVHDAKNNKVFQARGETSAEGVFSAQMAIASLVNTGRWRIVAKVGDDEVEKTVEVKPYVLPKFKVELDSERAAYRPGERVAGKISARYFFGEPLRRARVVLTAETWDVAARELARVSLELDESGLGTFAFTLPEMLAGQPLLQGGAAVTLTARVTDTAGQTHEGRKALTIYKDALKVIAIPEAGRLVPGVDNAIFFVVTTPDGAPAPRAKVVIDGPIGAGAPEIQTDRHGIAEWRVVPRGDLTLDVVVATPDGVKARHALAIPSAREAAAAVLLRPSELAPRAGDRVAFDVLVAGAVPHVFLDLVKDGQTLVTLSAPVRDGRAQLLTTLPPDSAGTVLAHAYAIGRDMDVYADTRPLVVKQADELTIAIAAERDGAYRPGEDATLSLAVTDRHGHPVLAALGLWAVDEAVFSLSELRPGMEQVFFLLEQAIMTPKVEVHAFEPSEVFFPHDVEPGPTPRDPVRVEEARRPARVLAAAAMPAFSHAAAVDSRAGEGEASRALWEGVFAARVKRLSSAVRAFVRSEWRSPSGRELHRILRGAGVTAGKTRDWFGVPFALSVDESTEPIDFAEIKSAGPDAHWGSDDDLVASLGLEDALAPVWEMQSRREERRWRRDGRGGVFAFGAGGGGVQLDVAARAPEPMVMKAGFGAGGDRPQGGAMVMRMPGQKPKEERAPADLPEVETDSGGTAGSHAGGAPRIRSYFPETLYVNPLIVTDANGRARVTIPLADSITTWRLSALGSAEDGRLGSASAGLKVFQDFFVDIAFPASLTRKDEISVPVAIYNYLPEAQTVELEIAADGGLATRGPLASGGKVRVELGKNEVKGIEVPLVATKVGLGRLTVTARGTRLSDAVRREVRIEPDGFAVERTESGLLSDAIELELDVPEGAIEGASTALLKLYPGMFAQVVDGLENMLKMPSGCFEQTSSATYPNILVLRYLRDAKRSKPELEATALSYLQAGWQRLVTYEVAGGGFSWFGEAPANKVLTAYGLMEFHDMDRVFAIDRKVIARTRAWIIAQQEHDGSWAPDRSHLHAESWGDMQKSSLIVSSYITWALAHTRPDRKALDAPLTRALAHLARHVDQADDAYVLGYMAMAFAEAAADRQGGDAAALRKVIDKLAALAVRDGDGLYFPTKLRTATYGSGEAATLEVTALALRALMRAGRHLDLVKPGLGWLAARKDQLGNWATTQATIQVLQAMIASLSTAAEPVAGEVLVHVNGELVTSARYSPEDFDVVRFIDASNKLVPGKNRIRLTPSEGMTPMFQLAASSYLPWGHARQPTKQAFEVAVDYDRTTMERDAVVGVKVTVRSNLPGVASMGIVDVAVPPGFEVLSEDLERAVADGVLQRFTLAGRQIIMYVPELRPDTPFSVRYRVRARFPLRAASGGATAWEYYNPDHRGLAAPAPIRVD